VCVCDRACNQVVKGWTGAQVEHWAIYVLLVCAQDAARIGAAWTGEQLVGGAPDSVDALELTPWSSHKLRAAMRVTDWAAESVYW
jgi:hypothetical protein